MAICLYFLYLHIGKWHNGSWFNFGFFELNFEQSKSKYKKRRWTVIPFQCAKLASGCCMLLLYCALVVDTIFPAPNCILHWTEQIVEIISWRKLFIVNGRADQHDHSHAIASLPMLLPHNYLVMFEKHPSSCANQPHQTRFAAGNRLCQMKTWLWLVSHRHSDVPMCFFSVQVNYGFRHSVKRYKNLAQPIFRRFEDVCGVCH